MAFSHGNASGDHDLVEIMHDPVHDCIRNWTVIARISHSSSISRSVFVKVLMAFLKVHRLLATLNSSRSSDIRM